MRLAKKLLRQLLNLTRYELVEKKNRLPTATFDNVRLVLAYYLAVKPDATLVQVGANDGIMDDPVGDFVRLGKMKAVLVEPQPDCFKKLEQVYKGIPNVSLIQDAIGTEDGNAILFKVKTGSQSDAGQSSGWASFDKAQLVKHKVPERDIEEIKVPCLTMKSLLAKFQLGKVDLLQIDTEGFDAEIVQMALNLPSPPDCINFEHINLSVETKRNLFNQLKDHGYVWTHDKYNTLALHRALTDRLSQTGGQT